MLFETAEFQYSAAELEKIDHLRSLVETNRNLFRVGTEDILLSKFLSRSQWQVENAYSALIRYYDFKLRNPTWVASHNVEYFREMHFYTQCKIVMPRTDKEGRAIFIMKTYDGYDKYPNFLQDNIELDDLIFESLLLLPQVQKNGITVIYDLNDFSKNHISTMTPSNSRLMNEKNGVLPFAKSIVHIIQRGFWVNLTSTLVFPFFGKDFKAKIFTHDSKNLDKLRTMIGYDNLPAEYGGPAENIMDPQLIYNHLLKNENYLSQLQTYERRAD